MRVSRRDDTDPDSASDNNSVEGPLGSEDTTHNLFKQYFESHFEALPHLPRLKREHEHHTDDGASDENMGDWEGIIDDEGLDESVIIDQGNTAAQSAELPLSSKRFFMSSRPPILAGQPKASEMRKADSGDEENTKSEAANLRKDLALQRLLRESNLLDTQSSFTPTGKKRHKALDIQLQDLGSKSSVYTQNRMPLSHRRGIQAKAMLKEKERRQAAVENGIILEKATTGAKKVSSRRTRSVGTPSVGRFQGGMLKLSKKDIADIKGPKPSAKRKR